MASNTYKARLHILGKIYNSSGASIHEALENLDPEERTRAGLVKGKGIIALVNGEKSQERTFTHFAITRLFSRSKLTRELALKNTASRFNV